jgi:hypothetical protein
MKKLLLILLLFAGSLSFANISPLKVDLTKGDVRKALVESNKAHGYELVSAYYNADGKLVLAFSNGTEGKRFVSSH